MDKLDFQIREAAEDDRESIVDVYRLSQEATGLPDPEFYPSQQLSRYLYERLAVRRYVAEHAGGIIGHGLVELPNPENIPDWINGTKHRPGQLLELGGAFVHPDYSGEGVWTSLLEHRLRFVKQVGKTAVAATWQQNEHVARSFDKFGGVHVASKSVTQGNIVLYRFEA